VNVLDRGGLGSRKKNGNTGFLGLENGVKVVAERDRHVIRRSELRTALLFALYEKVPKLMHGLSLQFNNLLVEH
jgi:hypothetical protein